MGFNSGFKGLITTFGSWIQCLWGGVPCCQHIPGSVSGSSASLVAACWEKLLPLFPDVLFQIHRCPWFLFVHLALEISSEEEVLRLGTLVPMNIEVATKYPLSQDRIVVFENRLHSKSPMLYRPALHGNWNALSLTRRALKDKFPTPTVPLNCFTKSSGISSRPCIYSGMGDVMPYLARHFQFRCRPNSIVSHKPLVVAQLGG